LPFWLLKGRANLKFQLAQRVEVSSAYLPVNSEFQTYLEEEKARGRKLVLISASNQSAVEKISKHWNLFDDAFGSDEKVNLRAQQKLEKIRELNSDDEFVYAGNSDADLPIWKESSEAVLVNCGDKLASKVDHETVLRFDIPNSRALKLLEAMRPHQWLKNLLVFVPLVLSHQVTQLDLLLLAVTAYVSFCLCASAVYLLNDMLDLQSDRQHRSKRNRSLASGELPLAVGFVASPLLFLAGIIIALALPNLFVLVLLGYGILTSLYSFYLKRLFLLDVFILAILYTIRIVAGASAITVQTTDWLLAFSFFLFFGLALVKRVTELINVVAEGKQKIEGRAYGESHLRLLSRLGILSSALAIAVFVLYITAPETTQLYSSPLVLWLICPLLMFSLFRIWRFAHLRKLEEDPVLFALTDRIGQVIALACGLLIWIAA
jgi:4-hydroxybenzoate polyprenyltransferase